MKFLDYITINPKISLKKGRIYPFIEMSSVGTSTRQPEVIGFKEFGSGAKFQDGDTVIARITPCLQNGKKFYCKNINKGFGSTEYMVFRPKDESVDSLFLYYFMQTEFIKKNMINSMTGATGRQRVNADVFNDLEVKIPPVDKQKNIGGILSTYDDLIENNKKQIKLLEEVAQRLYKEWFVDFRFPGYEKMKFIDGIPEGWQVEKIKDIIGRVPKTKQIKKTDYLNIGNIPIIDQSRNFIAGYTNEKKALVNIGEPIIVFGDHTRILKYITFGFAKGADGTQLIISNRPNMPQSLLYLSLVNIDLSNYHYARHFKYLKEEKILVPTKEIADNFDFLVASILVLIQKLRDSCNDLSQARDRLLPKLMSGEIEV